MIDSGHPSGSTWLELHGLWLEGRGSILSNGGWPLEARGLQVGSPRRMAARYLAVLSGPGLVRLWADHPTHACHASDLRGDGLA